MLLSIIFLLISLLVILGSAEGFTNGIEIIGRKFSLSQAVVGSILAAVGTALPETILPIVAIAWGAKEIGKDIGVGAILGAPFMLTTLAFFLVGLTIVITFIKKKRKFEVNAENKTLKRDLLFFIVMYSSAVFIPAIFGKTIAIPLAIFLLASYFLYVFLTINAKSAALAKCESLHILKLKAKLGYKQNLKETKFIVIIQVLLSLFLMVGGAKGFVNNLETISLALGFKPLLFALLLAPVATELPEKFNSISWTLKGKDALAIGNITGAMVFQTTFPVSVGLLFTEWRLTPMALFSAIIALFSALVVLSELIFRKRISPFSILFGGILYVLYIIVLIR